MKNALILPRFATGIFQFCDYNYDDFRAWAAYPQKIFKIKRTCELAIHAPFSSLIQPKFTQSFFQAACQNHQQKNPREKQIIL